MTVFNWREFLRLAERLNAQQPDEAAYRPAISRAYYAAYHVAADFTRRTGLLPGRHTHKRVWSVLAAASDPELVTVGHLGDWLRRERIDADYRSQLPDRHEAHVPMVLATARQITTMLDAQQ